MQSRKNGIDDLIWRTAIETQIWRTNVWKPREQKGVGSIILELTHTHTHTHIYGCAQLLQSCLTLCDPMYWSLPGSFVHVILQSRILEWIAMPPPGDLWDPGIEPEPLGKYISPREGNGYPLLYSCLGNSIDRGDCWAPEDWWTTVYGVAKSQT